MQLINKALFKQSAKANWMRWTVVTVATCVMLAIVIIVLGNLGINDIRDSLKNVFTEANQDSQLKEESIDAYDSYFTIMENYDGLYGMLGIDFNGTVGSKIENTCTQFDAYYQDFVTQNGREPNETERQTLIDNAVQSFIDSFGVSEDFLINNIAKVDNVKRLRKELRKESFIKAVLENSKSENAKNI